MKWFLARLREPSTWSGIAGIAAAAAASIPSVAPYAGPVSALCGAVAVMAKDPGSAPSTPL